MSTTKAATESGHGEAAAPSHGHGGGHGGAGHGGGGHEEAHEGAPEWLISFADNVALMMGFFVILLALNMAKQTVGGIGGEGKMGTNTPSNEMLDWVLGVREAFNNPVDINSSRPEEQMLVRRLIQRRGNKEAREPGVKGRDQEVTSIRPSDYHAVSGNILFDDDSSRISDEAMQTVRQVTERVKGINLIIEVRGHVRAAEAVDHDDRGMALAYGRALAVASELAAGGVDWWRMRLVGCADNDRVVPFPADVESDRLNARVEVIVTDQVAPTPVPTSSESAGHSVGSEPAS